MKAEIKVERIERECPYNTDVRAGKIKGHAIYDWRVFINGEYRAQFRPGTYKGYNIVDPDGFGIKVRERTTFDRRSDVAAKAEFEEKVRSWLGLIPTLQQLDAAREARRRKSETDESARNEAERVDRIRDAALDLLAALEACRTHLALFIGPDDTVGNTVLAVADDALAKARGT